ncbi:hypothetical protein BZA05DRAFT_383408 [Tricharina praecox]|uniref:uncharacterized protein n=1 Tax=Tricharina praecox TaxID=43433 RepID=UPI00221F42B9|nr:uncharacterized protein BZA05DRAFT_383408 [Tricharina praecox]KAI5859118.1 hypothetical protein BZA05DRAFT_383408 [Tricharina praecox]
MVVVAADGVVVVVAVVVVLVVVVLSFLTVLPGPVLSFLVLAGGFVGLAGGGRTMPSIQDNHRYLSRSFCAMMKTMMMIILVSMMVG